LPEGSTQAALHAPNGEPVAIVRETTQPTRISLWWRPTAIRNGQVETETP
jgi:hypothetical protein